MGPEVATVGMGKERERDGRVHNRLRVVANAACEPAAEILPETTRHMTLLVT